MTQGLTKADYDQIWEWNKVVPDSIKDPVHELILKNVKSTPDAQAVCSWDGTLTYAELDDLSSRLAEVLKKRGVGPEVIVPLCFEKSAWTIVAMLATARVGGAFVLLDAKQPESRLRDIVSLTKANFVVSSPSQQEIASKLAPEVLLVSHSTLIALPTATNSPPTVDPESTLFIVFTSGSTGLPKGVMSSHQSFVSGVHYRRSILEVPSPRVFDFASYSFDVSTDIILSTLIIGGCVCVPLEWERQNDIAGAINRLEVNSADLTPSVARLIDPDSVPGLKVLKLGGELSSVTDIARWAPKTHLVNVYGPSECLLVAINTMTIDGDPRTIGRGHGAVTWIVDPNDHNKLVPVGTVGELLVEGPIVTKGYLHDLERTASVFINAPDWLREGPSPDRSSARLYKTGDLVHYNPDGTLNFVGRKDTQVKVRGQRVELSEVEHNIQQQLFSRTGKLINPIVELITAGANEGSGGRPTLVGFFAMSQVEATEPENDQQLRQTMWNLTKDLNKSLLKILPQYMVPSVYIPVWKYPLNSSGKTDRRQLQKIGTSLSRQELSALRTPIASKSKKSVATPKSKSPPSTFAERRMQRMWSKVLGLELNEIGREDNFFQLGGDSLNAIQLATLASNERLSLSVENIFGNPVLAHMSSMVKSLIESPAFEASLDHKNEVVSYTETKA